MIKYTQKEVSEFKGRFISIIELYQTKLYFSYLIIIILLAVIVKLLIA